MTSTENPSVLVRESSAIEAGLESRAMCRTDGLDGIAPSLIQSHAPVSTSELALAELVARVRPQPMRAFDQIPMRTADLARQTKLIAPMVANQRVVFVGDMDGTATLLGLFAANGGPAPAKLLVLDFDSRVLEAAMNMAQAHGFAEILSTRLYNCFDPVPRSHIGMFDWFYLNPPYGSHNGGESARLFITRGCELVTSQSGSGCLILPDDPARAWTRDAMLKTQRFLSIYGWTIREKLDFLHRYHLDDDPELQSSLLIVDRVEQRSCLSMPFAGRRVRMHEIPHFYSSTMRPPYPSAIGREGNLVWPDRAA